MRVKNNLFAFSTAEKKKVFYEFIRSVNDNGGLPGTDSFNTYDDSRIKGVDGFAKIKTPDDKTVAEKLKAGKNDAAASDAEQAAFRTKESITDALKRTEAYTTAKDSFNTDLANLNILIQEDPPKFTLGDITSQLGELEVKRKPRCKSNKPKKKTI